MRVLVQFRSPPQTAAATLRGEVLPPFAAATAEPIAGLVIDPAFLPVQVPTPQAPQAGANPYNYSPAVTFSTAPLGQRISINSTVFSLPNPKCARRSLDEA